MQHPNLQDALSFIRNNGMLKTWNDSSIISAIKKSIDDYAFTYTRDNTGKLDGIVIGQWNSKESYYCICCIGKLSVFLTFIRTNFPNCKEVVSERYGEIKTLKL